MLPKFHPLVKTATQLRQSLHRLQVFKETNPDDEFVKDGTVSVIERDLSEARSHIPKHLRDQDLKEA